MSEWEQTRLGDLTAQVQDAVRVVDDESYPLLGVRWYAEGPFLRETVTSETSKATRFFRVRSGQFIYNRLFAWKGSFGLVGPELEGSYVSNEFPLFECDRSRLLPEFLNLYFQQPKVWSDIERVSTGTTASRNRWKESQFNDHRIALPLVAEQRRVVDVMKAVDAQIYALAAEAKAARVLLRARRSELLVRESATIPVKKAFSVLMGRQRAPQHASGPYMTNYLRSANIGDGVLDLADIKQMNFNPDDRAKFGLRVGDVLVSEGSASAAAVGLSAVWHGEIEDPVCFQKTLLRFRAINGVSTAAFTNHWCQWAYESGTFLKISSGTNIKHITAVRVLEVPVALPGIEEQTAIADELDSLETQRTAVREELARLRSFRSVLLASLLSGEIEISESYDALLEAVS
ncbi:restriction endonuclease subunit S [Mycolicibacterium houstonense]|uniref:restriction endonuclease subunit S n=1 Tax=Mycolicibacterium houstonense TaxID=146021 RepID=UPI003F9883A5